MRTFLRYLPYLKDIRNKHLLLRFSRFQFHLRLATNIFLSTSSSLIHSLGKCLPLNTIYMEYMHFVYPLFEIPALSTFPLKKHLSSHVLLFLIYFPLLLTVDVFFHNNFFSFFNHE